MHFRVNFQKKWRGSPFHGKICLYQKCLWRSRTSKGPSKSIIRFLTIVIWNLEKGQFRRLINCRENFFWQTEFVIGKSDFFHLTLFYQTKCLIFVKFEDVDHWETVSVELRKAFAESPFFGGWVGQKSSHF